MKNYKLKIFCDFDGTVAVNDIWINSLGKFIKDESKFNEVLSDFNDLAIGGKECACLLLDLIEDFSFEEFNRYLDQEMLDPFFKEFVSFCGENDISLAIVSGGFDYYINYILQKEELDVKFFSSKLISETGKDGKTSLSCEFPYGDENCSLCETSKRNILINHTNDLDNEISVYIGDGISDFCVVNYADLVFAKGKLASYCWKNNITYFDYTNFNDVINKLRKLLERKTIKHRQEAKIKRRDVFLGG
jgi:2-hydroxy-3-keto-5-methylthiopentenyl-1-phosphate phosphatase